METLSSKWLVEDEIIEYENQSFFYDEEDIKNFIKGLKSKMEEIDREFGLEIVDYINKLAGDRLI